MSEKNVTKKEVIRHIKVGLTKDELQTSVDQLIVAWKELDEALASFEKAKKEYKEEIRTHETEIADLREQLETKEKAVETECILEFHWDKNYKNVIQKETGKKIAKEDITDDERQTQLDLETHGAPVNGKEK